MANIVNPQAVRFAKLRARPLAQFIASMYRTFDQFDLDVVRDFEDQTGGDANEDVIMDNAAADGLPIVTKENVAQLKFVVGVLRTALETEDYLALVNNWVGSSTPIF